jgi:hypothetical protein
MLVRGSSVGPGVMGARLWIVLVYYESFLITRILRGRSEKHIGIAFGSEGRVGERIRILLHLYY